MQDKVKKNRTKISGKYFHLLAEAGIKLETRLIVITT